MPFLNPPDVLPEAMRFAVRALLVAGGTLPESELLKQIAPIGLVEALTGESLARGADLKHGGRIIAQKSLVAMRGANLVSVDSSKDRNVSLSEAIREFFPDYVAVSPKSFASFLRATALRDASDALDQDDDQEEGGAEDLAIGLSMLLASPAPLIPFGAFDTADAKSFSRQQTDQLGERSNWVVRNRERYISLERWAVYLGFARFDVSGIIVDPSFSLEESARGILSKKDMPIAEFMDELGREMPSSDYGRLGIALKQRLLDSPGSHQLFPGTALGLMVLQGRKVVALSNLSDAESFAFPVGNDPEPRFSHIRKGE